MIRTFAIAGLALGLTACASFDPEKWAAAANEHDAGCYAHKKITVVPMLIGIWPVPVFSATYEAVCNPEKAPAPVVQAGALIQ